MYSPPGKQRPPRVSVKRILVGLLEPVLYLITLVAIVFSLVYPRAVVVVVTACVVGVIVALVFLRKRSIRAKEDDQHED
jgi:hypothetical protein